MKSFDRSKLKNNITDSVMRVYHAEISKLDIYRNTLDCFSAVIDSLVQGITLDEWITQERARQMQKTKQNAIGNLHEDILGSIDGVIKLPVGNIIDIVSDTHRIVAEVKNKHNTTKGNHKVAIYRDLATAISQRPGYTGYYVEILPANAKQYNNTFTPSDNTTKTRLPEREDIRIIDGKSFYALLTGHNDALLELYRELPLLISEILQEQVNVQVDTHKVTDSQSFSYNFEKAYGETV